MAEIVLAVVGVLIVAIVLRQVVVALVNIGDARAVKSREEQYKRIERALRVESSPVADIVYAEHPMVPGVVLVVPKTASAVNWLGRYDAIVLPPREAESSYRKAQAHGLRIERRMA